MKIADVGENGFVVLEEESAFGVEADVAAHDGGDDRCGDTFVENLSELDF